MKNFILSLSFLSASISTPWAHADIVDTIPLSSPGKLCFSQTSLHAESPIDENGYRLDKVMFTHYLIIPKEDHFKKGAVFVGFRLKSQPEKLWLYDGYEWKIMNDDEPQTFFGPTTIGVQDIHTLQPITHTYISNFPIDVKAYADDGELMIGYGIMSESGTVRDAFYEMVQTGNRFKVLWQVGNNLPNTLLETVCLDISGMTVTIPTANHF